MPPCIYDMQCNVNYIITVDLYQLECFKKSFVSNFQKWDPHVG